MILLDPDLESAPALTTISAKQVSASEAAAPRKNLRLPTTRTLNRFLAEAQATVRLKGEVTVLLTTDAAIRKLNRQFRHKNKATDVLSFPADGIGAEEIAGDLAISVSTASRQAVELDHTLSIELKVLILHGLLHLAGYDHETDDGKMARRERLLRERLRLPQGLIERATHSVHGKPATIVRKVSASKGHGISRAAKSSKKNAALEQNQSKRALVGSRGGGFFLRKKPLENIANGYSYSVFALAAGEVTGAKKTSPQGRKPKIHVGKQTARLKSCPSKAAAKAKRS
jgi:probable rRNA maturation factor